MGELKSCFPPPRRSESIVSLASVKALAALSFFSFCVAPTYAQTIDATSRGAYRFDGGINPQPLNYLAGSTADQGVFRNWLVFDIPALALGQVYGTAILRLNTRNIFTPDATETYELHDVTTPIATLENGTGGVAAFNDLGSGSIFGSRVYGANEDNTILDIALSSSAVSAINAKAGSLFAAGGSITTLSGNPGNEVVFGNSNDAPLSQTQLILTTISGSAAPEPSSLALLIPLLGGVCVAAVRRRR